MRDVWPLVHAERAALVEDLESLDDAAWETPSLCAGLDGARRGRPPGRHGEDDPCRLPLGLARAGFDFDRQNDQGVQRERRRHAGGDLAEVARRAGRTSTPPAPLDSRLVEAVVHGEDIRRPLGLVRAYPAEVVTRGLRLQARTAESFGGAKDLVTRVRLVATDADVAIGSGPDVRGPLLDLLLVATGRRAALAPRGAGRHLLTAGDEGI